MNSRHDCAGKRSDRSFDPYVRQQAFAPVLSVGRRLTPTLGSMSGFLASVRSISDAEASVVERALLVAATDASAVAFAAQVRSLQVVGRCGCGCASIDFRIPAQGQIARIVADAFAEAPSGEHLGLIVWALDDELSGLEVYSYSDAPAPLPALASVSSYDNPG